MGKWGVVKVCGCLTVLASVVGCAGEVAEDSVAQTSQAVVGLDEFLYLRCNATGWSADSATLLAASSTPGVYTLEYNVNAQDLVSGGDQCVLTRTNSQNGWGSASTSFGATSSDVVAAPGQWSIGAENSAPVSVRYPALGRYRASVNWTAGTVSIAAVPATPPVSTDYYYLRCNATGWGVDSTNRLTTATSGLALTYAVNQNWMVSNGDQCVVTRTNQLDGWGTSQSTLGTATSSTLVVAGATGVSANLVAPGQQFTVVYPAIGQYQARLNPNSGELRISVPGSDVPDTGLHGAVESLGGNRVRVTYNFETAEQLQDFVSTNVHATAVSIQNGRLQVQNVSAEATINAATLIKGFKVDSLSYKAELVEGTHISVYPGVVWDGNWNPRRGYGAVQRNDGRWLMANGVSTFATGVGAATPGVTYNGRIDTTEQGFTWTLNGDAQSVVFPYYGGTSRALALGGFGSTVAFDDLVLEGTVAGFESDGTETNPNVNHGTVENLDNGRVRITYDFSDPQQKYDFLVNDQSGTRRELNDGRLIVSQAATSSALKVALYKHHVRIDKLTYRAELLAGDHVNLYLNTIWDGNWAPTVGCAGIHRQDGRIVAVNGTVSATADTTAVAARVAYTGEVLLGASGLDWSVNGGQVSLNTPCYAGTDGTLGIGSYESDVAFDQIVIEGQLE